MVLLVVLVVAAPDCPLMVLLVVLVVAAPGGPVSGAGGGSSWWSC